MTEADWLGPTTPRRMLIFLGRPPAQRKMMLFALACCKALEPLLTAAGSHEALKRFERFAEGQADRSELDEACQLARDAVTSTHGPGWAVYVALRSVTYETLPMPYSYTPISLVHNCRNAFPDRHNAESERQKELLRDIFGNPFRPVMLDPAWITSSVKSLAQAIYEERAFDRLPILADALEDAGCTSQDILNHCRQPGEHCRGCWVVDLLLGKE